MTERLKMWGNIDVKQKESKQRYLKCPKSFKRKSEMCSKLTEKAKELRISNTPHRKTPAGN